MNKSSIDYLGLVLCNKPCYTNRMPEKREKNHNWKGGRTKTEHGYILIRVDISHHLADIRGYAYEHRLIAEEILGRPLKKNEIVHHVNGIKDDNRKENLIVLQTVKRHCALHPRKPKYQNHLIECACGCGEMLLKYDNSWRPRRYIYEHRFNESRRKNVKQIKD